MLLSFTKIFRLPELEILDLCFVLYAQDGKSYLYKLPPS